MTAEVGTLSAAGAATPDIRIEDSFNVVLTPTSDWSGQLLIQSSFDRTTWIDEMTETGDTDWGALSGRFIGLEPERDGVWYRAMIPAGGYTSGSMTVRFSR